MTDPSNMTVANETECQASLLSAADGLRLVSTFFDREWASTDISQVHIKQITGGMINTLQLIRRDNAAIQEPACLLIRHFGASGEVEEPAESSLTLSASQQAIVNWEMGRRGWGPRVFGLFPGGRVEEYIDSHTLTAAESTHEHIARDIARSYARFHSLELPLRRDGVKAVVAEFNRKLPARRDAVLEALLDVDDPVAVEYAEIFQSTDWLKELDWVIQLFEKHNCQTALTHGDSNYLNILIRSKPTDRQAGSIDTSRDKTKQDSSSDVVLIDYETTGYHYRGFDIGGHFAERMYTYNLPDTQMTGYPIPSLSEQTYFCQAYLDELERVKGSQGKYDTVEHLLLEAKIGRLYQYLCVNLMYTVFDEDEIETEPLFLSGVLHMMKTYHSLKAEYESEMGE